MSKVTIQQDTARSWVAADGTDAAEGASPDEALANLVLLQRARARQRAAERRAEKKAAAEAEAKRQLEAAMTPSRQAYLVLANLVVEAAATLYRAGYFEDLNEAGVGFQIVQGMHPREAYSDWSEFHNGRGNRPAKTEANDG